MITPEMLEAMWEELSRVDSEIERLSDLREALRTILENYGLRRKRAQTSIRIATVPGRSYAEVETPLGVFPNQITADIANTMQDGQPLHLTAIYERLKERDIFVAGKIPQNTISSHMSRDKEHFERVAKGTYRLKARLSSIPDPTPPTLFKETSVDIDEPDREPVSVSPEEPDAKKWADALPEPPRSQEPLPALPHRPSRPLPHRPLPRRPAEPESEKAFAAEDFDDVPF